MAVTFTVEPGADSRPILAVAMPGDTIVFKAGGHRRVKCFGAAAGGTFDGEPDKPITLYFEAGAEISDAGNQGIDPGTGEGINLEGCRHVIVDGAIIKNMTVGARAYIAGIRAVDGGNVTLRNCRVSGSKTWGVFTGFVDDVLIEDCTAETSVGQHGFYTSNSSRNVTLRRCVSRFNRYSGFHCNGDLRTTSGRKPTTGIMENVRFEDCHAENNGNGGAAYNLDGCDGVVLLRCKATGNRATALAAFKGDGEIPTTRVTVLHCDFDAPAGSRAAVQVNDGAGPVVIWNTRIRHADDFRPELVCDPAKYERGDYNEFSRWHQDSDAATRPLAEWKQATGKDANSVPHPGPVPVVPAGVPDPVASPPKYAGRDLIVSIPETVYLATPTPVSAKLTNAGSETWRKGGIVGVGVAGTTPDDRSHGIARLTLADDEVNPGEVGTFTGTLNTTSGGPLTFQAVAEWVAWFGPTASADFRVVLPDPGPSPDLAGILARLDRLERIVSAAVTAAG